ncbi:ABC transporter permease [Hoeflea marina]|nr:ABC transporter permease [Hoeflea marina]
MRMLDRKLLRDLGRLWAQALAVALVMACGVMTLILAMGASRSLEASQSAFYDRYRFASVFAEAVRAPRHLEPRIQSLPGVSAAELRIVKPVIITITGMTEPASGVVVSIPDTGESAVNRLYLRAGRLPGSRVPGEVAVVEAFAAAHGFRPGDRFDVVMNGKARRLSITGIVLSPEFIYAIGPGDMVPDPRRYGILYMSETVLSSAFGMEGAFNDAALTTMRNADTRAVIEGLDGLLAPYGGTGAYGRKDQMSHAFLDSELTQLFAMATIIPPIFLFVSAFLVNMILSRLIALEREQIGLLKAVGYTDLAVGWHYAKLVIVISAVGLAIGCVAGSWLGRGLTRLYGEFFAFPFLIFTHGIDLYAIAATVTVAAALAGASSAIWATVMLPPAVAMRPPSPTQYRSLAGAAVPTNPLFSQLTVMVFRHFLRWPLRSTMTIIGTALSVALLVTALFSFDSIDAMIDTIFFRADRQDATLTFASASGPEAVTRVGDLPGVIRVEPYRSTAVKLKNGRHERRMVIHGLTQQSELSRVLDRDLLPMQPPSSGLVLSERVAALLDLQIGDPVEIELMEFADRKVSVPVTGIAESYVGLAAYMELTALNRLLMEGRRVSGARILVDEDRLDELYAHIKQVPAIASLALQTVSRDRFRETVRQNISYSITIYVTLAIIITFGVIYNSARIQLSERARELASLRVFGFTRAEVSSVLLVELALIVIIAQPLGWLAGYGFAVLMIRGFESDLFRIPLVISQATYATASLVVIGSAVVSALLVRRRVDTLDLIRVLKTRD